MPSVSALQWQIRAGGGSRNPLPLNTSITPQVIPTMKLKLISVKSCIQYSSGSLRIIFLQSTFQTWNCKRNYTYLIWFYWRLLKLKKISELFIFQFWKLIYMQVRTKHTSIIYYLGRWGSWWSCRRSLWLRLLWNTTAVSWLNLISHTDLLLTG